MKWISYYFECMYHCELKYRFAKMSYRTFAYFVDNNKSHQCQCRLQFGVECCAKDQVFFQSHDLKIPKLIQTEKCIYLYFLSACNYHHHSRKVHFSDDSKCNHLRLRVGIGWKVERVHTTKKYWIYFKSTLGSAEFVQKLR